MTFDTSKSIRICYWLLLLIPIVTTQESGSPSNGEPPSTSSSFLPPWVSPAGIYNAILSRHGSIKCSSREGFQGICEAVEKCTSHAGVFRSSRVCAREGQVCCSVSNPRPIATCNELVDRSGVHFVNLPNPNTTELCGILLRIPPTACRLRLDFLAFKISQPAIDIEEKARCTDDVFSVHAGSSSVATPNLCGDNDNQHLLIAVKGSDHVYLNIKLALYLIDVQRYWNIRITFETCDSPDLAPTGCLQRYTARNGAVRPFNYGPSNQPIEGLKYQVCLTPKASTCKILMNNRLYNIRGPVFLNFVTQEITSVSIGPLYVIKNETTQSFLPVKSCRKRLGKSLQARESPVPVEPMKQSLEETSPKLLEWLISGSVKSLGWDHLKSAARMLPGDDEFQIEDDPGISRVEALRQSATPIFGGRGLDGTILTRENVARESAGADPERTDKVAQFVLEVPVDGITPSLQKVLAEDDYVTELLRTHDHDDHPHHEEHNITHIIPEHPDRAWIQQLHEQRTKAIMDRLNAIAQNHANSSHHGGSEHHNGSEHHGSVSPHGGLEHHGSLSPHEGSEHHGSLEHHGATAHHGTTNHHGGSGHNVTLCHKSPHGQDHAHPHLPPCEPEAEGASTTPAPVILTTVPPPEIFETPVEETLLVTDESEDEKVIDEGPDPPLPPLVVELKKTKENTTTTEPTCNGFKLPTDTFQICLKKVHAEKCYFDSLQTHRKGIQDDISKCNYSAPELQAHQHEFEEEALQQYHALTRAIHKHPTHKPHTMEHVHPTHQPLTAGHVHPTHPPHSGGHGHPSHGGPHTQHTGHSSGSAKPNAGAATVSGNRNQMVIPVVVYVPVASTIHNQFNQKNIHRISANLTQLLEESLRNSSSNHFLIEIGNPRAAGEGQPEVMTFSDQFELLYSFESC